MKFPRNLEVLNGNELKLQNFRVEIEAEKVRISTRNFENLVRGL
jgi:hypothetical protein